jgi:hypothetical protein
MAIHDLKTTNPAFARDTPEARLNILQAARFGQQPSPAPPQDFGVMRRIFHSYKILL